MAHPEISDTDHDHEPPQHPAAQLVDFINERTAIPDGHEGEFNSADGGQRRYLVISHDEKRIARSLPGALTAERVVLGNEVTYTTRDGTFMKVTNYSTPDSNALEELEGWQEDMSARAVTFKVDGPIQQRYLVISKGESDSVSHRVYRDLTYGILPEKDLLEAGIAGRGSQLHRLSTADARQTVAKVTATYKAIQDAKAAARPS